MDNLNKLMNSPLNGSTFGDRKSVLIKEKTYTTTLDIRVKPKIK